MQYFYPSVFEQGGFDIVIGNPPYLLLQNFTLNSSDAETLNKYYVAQYKVDLYHLFIQKGIELATKKGVITYITPNTFLKN